MKRILVTGGAGFVGSHLCDRLLSAGYEVVCLDNLQTGHLGNIAHLQGHPRFTFVQHDVEHPIDIEVEAIYHLACPASPVHYQADPVKTLRTCFLGMLHMLDLAKRRGIRILQASTSEVYGDPEVHPQIESYRGNVNPIGPRACYDEGKRVAETLAMDYHRQYGVNVCIARIFNTYGPRMAFDDGRVVSNFIIQALRGEPLTIYGNGSQTRSFCYVSDMVEGLILLMEHPDFAGPVNLGNDREFTIRELAERIVAKLGGAGIAYKPLPIDDPTRRQPDISLARNVLGWQPLIPIEEGLDRTIADFRQRMGSATRSA